MSPIQHKFLKKRGNELHEFSARTFVPIKNFFDGKIESPAPLYSFRIGPKMPWAEVPTSRGTLDW
jgi:hypothetical protein